MWWARHSAPVFWRQNFDHARVKSFLDPHDPVRRIPVIVDYFERDRGEYAASHLCSAVYNARCRRTRVGPGFVERLRAESDFARDSIARSGFAQRFEMEPDFPVEALFLLHLARYYFARPRLAE